MVGRILNKKATKERPLGNPGHGGRLSQSILGHFFSSGQGPLQEMEFLGRAGTNLGSIFYSLF
jgi:hypothetical protein